MSETASEPLVIDVRSIPKPQRHPLIFDAMDKLEVGQSLVVQNDHDPIPLRGQVAAFYGEQFAWRYLEAGPELFQLEFTCREAAPEGWQRTEPKSDLPMLPTPQVSSAAPVRVDLLAQIQNATHSGPQWGHECDDLDLTLLSWERGKRMDLHVNSEVDVVWISVEGSGTVTIDGQTHGLHPNAALLIPKGCERAVESTSERFSYLSVHRRRRGLMPVNNLKA